MLCVVLLIVFMGLVMTWFMLFEVILLCLFGFVFSVLFRVLLIMCLMVVVWIWLVLGEVLRLV